MLRFISYFIRHTYRSLTRNRWMGAASVATTSVALIILGFFLLAILNIELTSQKIESNLEIVVWLETETERSEVEDMKTLIQNLNRVTEVRLVPKEQGIKELNMYFGSETDLLETLGGENPLPDYLIVKVAEPNYVKETASRVKTFPHVSKVDYGQNYLDKLLSLLYWTRVIGISVVVIFLLAVIFIIGNTIRLTVYARSQEIAIMKLVGAGNWFIRFPFLLEGIFLGLVGSVIAGGIVYFSYVLLVDQLSLYLSFVPFLRDPAVLYKLLLILVGIGTAMGGVASYLSIGRYLKY